MPRRDSEENLSFWTKTTKRKFFEQQVVKETGFLPSNNRPDKVFTCFSRNRNRITF